MKRIKNKWLTKLVLSAVMAGCVGYSGLAQAEILDMSLSENMGGVTITDPSEELNNTYIYKWNKEEKSLVGGSILITSNSNNQYINAKIIVDKNDLANMGAQEVNKALNQLVGKLESQLSSKSYRVYADVCICDGTSEDAEVLRKYKVKLEDVDEGERNLNGYVQIAEGLTSASVAKRTGEIAFSEEDGSGSLAANTTKPEFVYPTTQTATEFNAPILGSAEEDMAFVQGGVRNLEDNVYTFTEAKTVINADANLIAGGPWLGQIASAVSGGDADHSIVLDLQGHELEINGTNEYSHSTGITSIGESTVVEVKNVGNLKINVEGGGQTAGLFVNGGGKLKIANAEGGTVVLRGNAARSVNGALVKSMNGLNGARSWIDIDGLVDISANVVDSEGIGEGLSAVASTIDVGGGRIIMNDDGSGETNFGGGNSFAIRAYGEFASQNYGIVNVNVVKEADTADAKAIGAGNRVTQIVGDFSTQGGMGTNGIINVGLNTEDSYWYGDYSAGAGFGVTPGSYGCLNLFMGNGALWEGSTKFATNLQMDSGSVWRGYAYDNDNLDMSLKNDAQWIATNAGVGDVTTSKVRNFVGATGEDELGSIYMSDENGVDVVIDNYSGKTMLLYQHNAAAPEEIIGGSFTINQAAAGSEILLSTDNNGIDIYNPEQVIKVLNSLAGQLFYNEVVAEQSQEGEQVLAAESEPKLKGQVQIAEGLLTSSAALKLGDIAFNTKDDAESELKAGQGLLQPGSVITPEQQKSPDIIYGDKETAMMSGAKSAMASTALMWRSEANDLLKRMGDLRLRSTEQGIWAKYYGGKYSMDDQKTTFTTKYNAYQVGYDQAAGNWIFGGALSYNNGESSYKLGFGDNEAISLAAYGTLQREDGTYVDVIVKRGKLDNEYAIQNVYGHAIKGDYKTWATSISAEYGKRMELKNGMFLDPSVEFNLGRVEGKSYSASSDYLDAYGKNKYLQVEQDDFDSLVGRLGIRFGQELDNSTYYCKLAVAHEFKGDFTTSFEAEAEPTGRTEIDLGDTWYEMQLGGSFKLNDNSLFYASYERSFGGDVEEKWRADAGLHWSF